MKIYTISASNLDSNNFYNGSGNFDGHLEIDGRLGQVKFSANLVVSGYILVKGGSGIKAGSGIEAGLTIIAKTTISAVFRIFAGVASWKIPTETEMEIRCEKIIKGSVAFGKLVIIKPTPQTIQAETIKVGNFTFDKNQVEAALANLRPINP